ncbi:hypothetical protein, partial [Streptomyces sp. URMC 123]|uniref:hypothetical protein n=1 Tax=Streptomyces sp. URMC 123 TaxID=3423403 RepID=UPI003F1B8046
GAVRQAPGVTAGYVGIGFDNHGNFASELAGPGGTGRHPGTLGIRGRGSGHSGFTWLAGVRVPRGFWGAWGGGGRVRVSFVDGRLTVEERGEAAPDGVLLLDGFDLARWPGQTPMPAAFKLGLAASTGAAAASHRIRDVSLTLPVDMSLEMSGPRVARAGERISYTIAVHNRGPNDAPDTVVEGAIPAALSDLELSCQTESGATCGAGSTTRGLCQPVDLPRGGRAVITLTGTVERGYRGSLAWGSRLTSASRANTSGRGSDRVATEVGRPTAGAAALV